MQSDAYTPEEALTHELRSYFSHNRLGMPTSRPRSGRVEKSHSTHTSPAYECRRRSRHSPISRLHLQNPQEQQHQQQQQQQHHYHHHHHHHTRPLSWHPVTYSTPTYTYTSSPMVLAETYSSPSAHNLLIPDYSPYASYASPAYSNISAPYLTEATPSRSTPSLIQQNISPVWPHLSYQQPHSQPIPLLTPRWDSPVLSTHQATDTPLLATPLTNFKDDEDDSSVLVGMGLYDEPEESTALKLTEKWEPPAAVDDNSDDDVDDDGQAEDEEEDANNDALEPKTPDSAPQALLEKSIAPVPSNQYQYSHQTTEGQQYEWPQYHHNHQASTGAKVGNYWWTDHSYPRVCNWQNLV